MIIQNGVGVTSLLNGETAKRALSPANETVNRGIYNATTLSAVDADLQAANIKLAEVIFGFIGTLAATLAEDIVGYTVDVNTGASPGAYYQTYWLILNAEDTIASKTQAYDANSMAVGVAWMNGESGGADMRLMLVMDGVVVAESQITAANNYAAIGTKALSGNKTCSAKVKNYFDDNDDWNQCCYSSGAPLAGGIAVGSIKV